MWKFSIYETVTQAFGDDMAYLIIDLVIRFN